MRSGSSHHLQGCDDKRVLEGTNVEKHWTSATVLASHQGQELSLAGRCSCDVPAGGLCWGSKASCPKTCWEAACWGTSKTDQLGAEGARTQAGSLPWGAMQTHREAAHYLGVIGSAPVLWQAHSPGAWKENTGTRSSSQSSGTESPALSTDQACHRAKTQKRTLRSPAAGSQSQAKQDAWALEATRQ